MDIAYLFQDLIRVGLQPSDKGLVSTEVSVEQGTLDVLESGEVVLEEQLEVGPLNVRRRVRGGDPVEQDGEGVGVALAPSFEKVKVKFCNVLAFYSLPISDGSLPSHLHPICPLRLPATTWLSRPSNAQWCRSGRPFPSTQSRSPVWSDLRRSRSSRALTDLA